MDKNTGAKWVNANIVAAGYCFDNNELFGKCVSGELNKFALIETSIDAIFRFIMNSHLLRENLGTS